MDFPRSEDQSSRIDPHVVASKAKRLNPRWNGLRHSIHDGVRNRLGGLVERNLAFPEFGLAVGLMDLVGLALEESHSVHGQRRLRTEGK